MRMDSACIGPPRRSPDGSGVGISDLAAASVMSGPGSNMSSRQKFSGGSMVLTSTDSATDDFVGFVPRSWGLLPGGLSDAGTQANGAKRSMIH